MAIEAVGGEEEGFDSTVEGELSDVPVPNADSSVLPTVDPRGFVKKRSSDGCFDEKTSSGW